MIFIDTIFHAVRSTRRWQWHVRPLCAVAALMALSACSVADYKKPISDMRSALKTTTDSVEEIDRTITPVIRERLVGKVIDGSMLLTTIADDECSADSARCRIGIFAASNGKLELVSLYPITTSLPEGLLPRLNDYLDRLQAIVDADTESQIRTSVNEAFSSVVKIDNAIARRPDGEPGKIAGYADSSVGMISWLAGQYVEAKKLAALRKATKRAHPVIEKLRTLSSTIGDATATYQFANATQMFLAAQQTFDDAADAGLTAQSIDAYAKAVSVYDEALRATNAKPFDAFVAAHRSMTDHLNGKDVSMADMIAAIENLKTRADEFRQLAAKLTQ